MGIAGKYGCLVIVSAGLLLQGCSSSDPENTEFIFNPGAITYTRVTPSSAQDTAPSWRPAGGSLAYVSTGSGRFEVWTIRTSDSGTGQVTGQRGIYVSRPTWSPTTEELILAANFLDVKTEDSYPLWRATFVHSVWQVSRITGDGVEGDWPAWSPDGTQVLFSKMGSLWTVSPGGGDAEVFDTGSLSGDIIEPVWSSDGSRVAYSVFDGHDYNIYVQDADGGTPSPLVATAANERSPAWSPGGRYLAYQSDATGSWDIWIIEIDGSSPTNVMPDSPYSDVQPVWDTVGGGNLAFISNRSGNDDIWLAEGLPFQD